MVTILTKFFQNLLHFKHSASLCKEVQFCLEYQVKKYGPFGVGFRSLKEEKFGHAVNLCALHT